jgi:hypothetical protein
LKAVSRILWRSALLWRDRKHSQNGHGIIYAAGSRFCKGKVVWAQLRRDGRQLHGMGVVDWISSRIGPITGRSLDLR